MARARRSAAVAVGITAVLGASASFAIAHVRPAPEPVYTVVRVVCRERRPEGSGTGCLWGSGDDARPAGWHRRAQPRPRHDARPVPESRAAGYLRGLLPAGTPVHLDVAPGAAPVAGRTLGRCAGCRTAGWSTRRWPGAGWPWPSRTGSTRTPSSSPGAPRSRPPDLGAGLFDDSLACTIPALLARSRVAMVAATETVEFVAPARAKPASDALAGPVALARGTSRSLSGSTDPIVVAVRSAPIVHDAQRSLDDAVANGDATRAALLSRDRVYQLSMKEIARRNALALERKRQLDALIRASQLKAAAEAKLAESQVLDDPRATDLGATDPATRRPTG